MEYGMEYIWNLYTMSPSEVEYFHKKACFILRGSEKGNRGG